jgi:hypothetical protein
MQASQALAHSGGGTGLGPLGPPAPRRACTARVRRDRRGGCVARRRARERWLRQQFRLTHLHSKFLQFSKYKWSKLWIPMLPSKLPSTKMPKALGGFLTSLSRNGSASWPKTQRPAPRKGVWPRVDLGFPRVVREVVRRVISTNHHWAKTRGVIAYPP